MNTALAIDRFQLRHRNVSLYFSPAHHGFGTAVVVLKTMALRTGNEHYNRCARFWTKIFAIDFAVGVVTGIPMEFQFGTNWAKFLRRPPAECWAKRSAVEGVYSFFLESTFLGLLIFGEKRLGPFSALAGGSTGFRRIVAVGFFIIATDAWMSKPGGLQRGSYWRYSAKQFSRADLRPVNIVAVPAQHDSGRSEFRHGRGGSVLPAGGHAQCLRPRPLYASA